MFHNRLTAAAIATSASTIVASTTIAAAAAVPTADVISAPVAGIATVGWIAVKIPPITLSAAAATPAIVSKHGKQRTQRPAISLVVASHRAATIAAWVAGPGPNTATRMPAILATVVLTSTTFERPPIMPSAARVIASASAIIAAKA
jgi:hypothetical protein